MDRANETFGGGVFMRGGIPWAIGLCLGVVGQVALADPKPTVAPIALPWASCERPSVSLSSHRRLPPDIRQLPLDEIRGPYRDRVLQILQKPVAFHAGTTEMFPCHPELLEWLIRHPVTVGDYWKQMGMTLTEVEPAEDGFVCRDDFGSVVHFHPVCETPNVRIAYCTGESPAGLLPIKMRAEMVVVHRYRFENYEGAGSYVVQQLDGYATASGVTLKMAMKLAPGQSEQMVEACLQEIKVFFSVMCRLMQLRPNWSLEKVPTVAARLSDDEKSKLEAILRSIPPARRGVPGMRLLDGKEIQPIAVNPTAESVK